MANLRENPPAQCRLSSERKLDQKESPLSSAIRPADRPAGKFLPYLARLGCATIFGRVSLPVFLSRSIAWKPESCATRAASTSSAEATTLCDCALFRRPERIVLARSKSVLSIWAG